VGTRPSPLPAPAPLQALAPVPSSAPAPAPAYSAVMAIDVVLTGFEPFGGDETNPSWEAVRRAAPALRDRGARVVESELPVEFSRAGDLLEQLVREHRPRMVIATGLAAGRTAVTPERV